MTQRNKWVLHVGALRKSGATVPGLREPFAGLDLPFKDLAYAQGESAAVIFTSAVYLKRRHGLTNGPDWQRYKETISSVAGYLPDDAVAQFNTLSLQNGVGIATLSPNYGHDQTIDRLKTNILAQKPRLIFLAWGSMLSVRKCWYTN